MLKELETKLNVAHTVKGAMVYDTTNSALVDFFAVAGSFRDTPAETQIRLLVNSMDENPELTMKAIFYFRDIRGGQGQRCGFYNQIRWLANNPDTVELLAPLIPLIPEYGRWDDLYQLFDTPLQELALGVMQLQFNNDIENIEHGNSISLLGKWLKSENASSKETKRLAKITRKFFKLSSRDYRKSLSHLRGFLDVVERKMTKGDWSDINYSNVPSQAMLKYRTSFYTHDEVRMTQFIKDVTSGKESINASTLYPAQIVNNARLGNYTNTADLDVLWNALPDYIGENAENSLAVVDVSGSMFNRNSISPIDVSLSLGLYLAERAKGEFANRFMTFSETPKLVKVVKGSLDTKINAMCRAEWGFNTNIEAVFDVILYTGIDNEIPQEEMIEKLYIISDMQFDRCATDSGIYLMETIKHKFESAGYTMPKLVFWNVSASNVNFPMTVENGIQMVSGYSPSIFTHLLAGEFLSAMDLVIDVLSNERYAPIVIST